MGKKAPAESTERMVKRAPHTALENWRIFSSIGMCDLISPSEIKAAVTIKINQLSGHLTTPQQPSSRTRVAGPCSRLTASVGLLDGLLKGQGQRAHHAANMEPIVANREVCLPCPRFCDEMSTPHRLAPASARVSRWHTGPIAQDHGIWHTVTSINSVTRPAPHSTPFCVRSSVSR